MADGVIALANNAIARLEPSQLLGMHDILKGHSG